MYIIKIKAAWAAIVRKFKKVLNAQADVVYPFDRIERFQQFRDERLTRFY